jgi:hypothetical protein
MIGENEGQKMGTEPIIDQNGNRMPSLLNLLDARNQPVFVCDVGAGYHHSIFLVHAERDTFHVWGCGSNSHKEIGDGIGNNISPTHLKQFDSKDIVKVRCGYYSTILISRDGKVTTRGMRTPNIYDLKALDNEFIVDAASGYSYHIFITAEGKCFVYVFFCLEIFLFSVMVIMEPNN